MGACVIRAGFHPAVYEISATTDRDTMLTAKPVEGGIMWFLHVPWEHRIRQMKTKILRVYNHLASGGPPDSYNRLEMDERALVSSFELNGNGMM